MVQVANIWFVVMPTNQLSYQEKTFFFQNSSCSPLNCHPIMEGEFVCLNYHRELCCPGLHAPGRVSHDKEVLGNGIDYAAWIVTFVGNLG